MPIEIAFQSRALRAICESPARAKRELGEAASKALRRVLADMNAAETVAELFEMQLGIDACSQGPAMLRLRLSEELCLYCNPNQQRVSKLRAEIDWAQVTRLKVVSIGDGK